MLSVDADEPPSSLLAQEMMVKLKRNRERIMSICLIGFLIGYFRRTLHIPKLGVFYKNAKVLLKKFENKCIFKSQFQS